LNLLNNTELYTDIVFKVGSGESEVKINAHKNILAARSLYFKTLFQSGMKETVENTITIDDEVSSDAFLAVLKYLYSGNESFITPEVSFELLPLSEKYFLPDLKWICASNLEDNISADNVASMMSAAELHECTKLVNSCLTFISNNHQEVIKTEGFKNLPQQLLLKVMGVVSARK